MSVFVTSFSTFANGKCVRRVFEKNEGWTRTSTTGQFAKARTDPSNKVLLVFKPQFMFHDGTKDTSLPYLDTPENRAVLCLDYVRADAKPTTFPPVSTAKEKGVRKRSKCPAEGITPERPGVFESDMIEGPVISLLNCEVPSRDCADIWAKRNETTKGWGLRPRSMPPPGMHCPGITNACDEGCGVGGEGQDPFTGQ